jgi:hypothetical protein
MDDGKIGRHLSYNGLEFFVKKEDRNHTLNTYILKNNLTIL